MPISYTFSEDSAIVYSKAVGTVTLREFLEYLESVVADPVVTAGFVELVDFGSATDFQISYADTSPFAPIWKSYVAKGCRGTVVYAPGDEAYGVVRMVRGAIGNALEDSEAEFAVTRSLDEAMEILDRMRGEADLHPIP